MNKYETELQSTQGTDLDTRTGEAGISLVEVIGVVFLISVLSIIGVNLAIDYREKARLVKCMTEIRGIQAAVFNMGDGRYIPTPSQFWKSTWPDGRKHGPYYYLTDGDPTKGHGNDLDGVDEENPGKSDPDKKDIKFVILCQHDHGDLADFVYLTDEEPPIIAKNGDDHPDYERFIKWEFGGPGGGKPKKK